MNQIYTLKYGKNNINYNLIIGRRKTLEIAVHPDKSVVVKAPYGFELDLIKSRIKKRAKWIKNQVDYFEQFNPRTPERNYISGETHIYSGKKYRLKIEKSIRNNVSLKNGYLNIETIKLNPEQVRVALESWYKAKAEIIFQKIFLECWQKFKKHSKTQPTLRIKKMKKRWGSLTTSGVLYLNLDLIRTPRGCVEYVIIHELCHLVHHDHSSEFYKLLDRSMPDWIKRKHKLEMAII